MTDQMNNDLPFGFIIESIKQSGEAALLDLETSQNLQAMGQSAIDRIQQLVTSSDSTDRHAACIGMAFLKDISFIPLLVNLTQDTDKNIRLAAARAISAIDLNTDHELLAKLLDNDSPLVRDYVIRGISGRPDASLIYLIEPRLGDKNESVRESAAIALGRIGDERAFPSLIAALSDENSTVRLRAVQALGEIQSVESIGALTSMFKDNFDSIGFAATSALSKIGPKAIPAILSMSDSKNDRVRRFVAETLGLIGDAKAIPTLLKLLEDNSRDVGNAAAISLGKIGDQSFIKHLAEAYHAGFALEGVVAALGQFKDETNIDLLIEALSDETLRRKAAQSLRRIGSKRTYVLRAMVSALFFDDIEVTDAAVALLQTAPEKAMSLLIEAFEYNDAFKRQLAIDALAEIGDENCLKSLREIMLHDPDAEVRQRAIWATNSILDKTIVASLYKAVDDSNPDVARQAQETLHQIAQTINKLL